MSSPPAAAAMMIRLLSASVAAANRAGLICREVMSSGKLGIVDKGGNDPQTEADRKAQRCIVNTLASKFPKMTIYGEETLEPSEEDQLLIVREDCQEVLKEKCPLEFVSTDEKDVTVWVDPLDGTAEFTDGFIEHVTVLIGIAVKGEPVAGVIHRPFLNNGQTYWGLKGLGTRGIDVVNPLPPPPLTPDQLRIVITRTHYTELIHKTADALKPKEILKMGGCGNKIMLVVEGKVDAYIYPSLGTKKWDSCAGDAIVRELGGVLTDVNGQRLTYNSWEQYRNRLGLVVAMNKDTHQAILDKIPQEVKDALAAKSS